jgi:hypothetical protein
MTEAEWWGATDSLPHVDWIFFETPASERKLRLFACACCRRIEGRLPTSKFRDILSCAEQFADGAASEAETVAAYHEGAQAYQDQWGGMQYTTGAADACRAVISAVTDTQDAHKPFHRSRGWYESEDNFPYPYWAALEAADAAEDERVTVPFQKQERFAQVRLLHDIFGPLPFREVAADPRWLTADVVALAKGIYDEKAFDRLPILADALPDAGCDNDELLKHCRAEKWEHVRGCWVVDLLLGRPWREPAP